MPWVLLSLGAVALLLVGGREVLAASAGRADASGVVQTDPTEIARSHGVSLEVEALARLMVSEAGSKEAAQVAVGWAARNYARRKGDSISAILLRGRTKAGLPTSSEGKFGAQNTGKYASTRAPSTSQSRALAAKILSGAIKDPTGGATQFDAPSAQNTLTAAGVAGYTKTADAVAASRALTASMVMVPGVSNIRFWVPKSGGVA